MRRSSPIRLALLALCVANIPSLALGADPTYWQDIRPVLRKHCTVCHSQKNLNEPDVSGGIALDSLETIQKSGKKPVVKSGKAKESLLITALRHPEPARRMPLDADPLPESTIQLLSRWIDTGLKEGTRTGEKTAAAPGRPATRRKTDVIVATRTSLPASVAKPGQTAPLELVAPIGPLPAVTAIQYSPDGGFLAVGGYGTVFVWNLKSAQPARVLTNVLGSVNDLKFHPDGSIVAVAGGQPSARGDIRLFSTSDWSLTGTLGGHTDVVGSVAFSSDGKQLASASFDKTVKVWNHATRQSVWTFGGHSDFVHAVACGPDGDWLVTASKDRTGRLVDLKTGQGRLTFSGTEQEVLAVGVTRDGKAVLTGGMDSVLSWWNPQTGERLKRSPGHSGGTNEIVVGAKGDLAASVGADRTVRLWNTKAMDSLRTIAVGSVGYSVALSPDAQVVAVGSFDGQVRLFETATGRPLATLVGVNESDWAAVTPEGLTVAGPQLRKSASWRTGARKLNEEWVWKSVAQPAAVVRALAGNKAGEAVFSAPQP